MWLSLCLFTSLAHAADPTPATSPHDLGYSLGASLGTRLHDEVPGLQLDALIEGLRQAYKGEPLALSNERIEQILTEHDAQAAASSAQPQSEKGLSAERDFLAAEKARPGVRALPNGILITELKAGTGNTAKASGRVQVTYKGMLPDGSVFDENSQPQWFGLDSVIEGWRDGMEGMPVGAKWRLVIPSALAYGAQGAGDVIAPYTPLTFEVELLGVAD
jgi:peptidylprolyl isomerase/FKBP-type peptidyl-prolyl cis-trans isomerase FklB